MPEFIDPENNLKPIPTNVALQTKEDQLYKIESSLKEFKVRKKQERLEDYDRVRKNILDLIEDGRDLFLSCKRLAEESDQGRTYEVAGGILRTLVDTNRQLLDIQSTVDIIVQFEDDEEKEENNQETKGISLTTQQLMELIVQNRSKKPE